MLASFLDVLPILTPPLCVLAFVMCSKFNPLVVFALDCIFLIRSSVVGHLGYFHSLDIVNSAAINMGV
jgi:hypothetical protein